jgi:hypothetical protein
MWVEMGKEEEARAEKAKQSAPPPSLGSISAASSTTSLNALDAPDLRPPSFKRQVIKLGTREAAAVTCNINMIVQQQLYALPTVVLLVAVVRSCSDCDPPVAHNCCAAH